MENYDELLNTKTLTEFARIHFGNPDLQNVDSFKFLNLQKWFNDDWTNINLNKWKYTIHPQLKNDEARPEQYIYNQKLWSMDFDILCHLYNLGYDYPLCGHRVVIHLPSILQYFNFEKIAKCQTVKTLFYGLMSKMKNVDKHLNMIYFDHVEKSGILELMTRRTDLINAEKLKLKFFVEHCVEFIIDKHLYEQKLEESSKDINKFTMDLLTKSNEGQNHEPRTHRFFQ